MAATSRSLPRAWGGGGVEGEGGGKRVEGEGKRVEGGGWRVEARERVEVRG